MLKNSFLIKTMQHFNTLEGFEWIKSYSRVIYAGEDYKRLAKKAVLDSVHYIETGTIEEFVTRLLNQIADNIFPSVEDFNKHISTKISELDVPAIKKLKLRGWYRSYLDKYYGQADRKKVTIDEFASILSYAHKVTEKCLYLDLQEAIVNNSLIAFIDIRAHLHIELDTKYKRSRGLTNMHIPDFNEIVVYDENRYKEQAHGQEAVI